MIKKDTNIIIGTVALSLALFVGAFYFYKQSQKNSGPSGTTAITRADPSLLIRNWSPTLGPSMARIVLVEFLDPECESCRGMHPLVKKILKDYDGKIHYVLRYMPFHPNSVLAAKWLEASRTQDKYWIALDALFERQPEWGDHHRPRPELIPSILETAGIDIKKAALLLENPEYEKLIMQDKDDGRALGVSGTPTFFVNGRMLEELGYTQLKNLIDEELKNF